MQGLGFAKLGRPFYGSPYKDMVIVCGSIRGGPPSVGSFHVARILRKDVVDKGDWYASFVAMAVGIFLST